MYVTWGYPAKGHFTSSTSATPLSERRKEVSGAAKQDKIDLPFFSAISSPYTIRHFSIITIHILHRWGLVFLLSILTVHHSIWSIQTFHCPHMTSHNCLDQQAVVPLAESWNWKFKIAINYPNSYKKWWEFQFRHW